MDDNSGSKVKFSMTAGMNSRKHAAVALISIGVLFFIDNLNILPFVNLRAYWPLAISAYGIALLAGSRSIACSVWHVAVIAAGVLLTLGNLGFLHATAGSIWPIFLIAGGVNMLLKGPSWTGFRARQWPSNIGASVKAGSSFQAGHLHEAVVFSGVKRRIDSPNFETGDLTAVFGEVKVDLRGATISSETRRAVIEANAVFGAIKLRIPETWRVDVRGTAVFGAYEDKTVPPRPVAGIDTPTLVITGGASFGAVEIEN